jgi:GT2 family glycosyltransferase
MSPAVDELNYNLLYEELIGGVLNLRKEHLLAVNGYSNLYWGWGAEDDDMYYRLKSADIPILRPPYHIGRYKMSKHKKRNPQSFYKRVKLLYSTANRMLWDGISSVEYKLLNVTKNKLFTHLMIEVGKPPLGFE